MPLPAQGTAGACAPLSVINGNLFDPETGEVFGPAPALDLASIQAEIGGCGKPNTLPSSQRENAGSEGSLVKRCDSLPDTIPDPDNNSEARLCDGTARRRSRTPRPWYARPTWEGRKVSGRVIDHETRTNAIEAAGYAADRGTPLTLHVTQCPNLDHLDPAERVRWWQDLRIRMAKASQNCGIPFDYIRVRESNAKTHEHEHAHWLVAVPSPVRDRWIALVSRQCPDTVITTITDLHGMVRYVLKAAAVKTLAAEEDVRYVRRSGAVVGDRVLISRSLDRKRREAAYAANPVLVERRDGRLIMEANDRRLVKEMRIAAGRRRAQAREAVSA